MGGVSAQCLEFDHSPGLETIIRVLIMSHTSLDDMNKDKISIEFFIIRIDIDTYWLWSPRLTANCAFIVSANSFDLTILSYIFCTVGAVLYKDKY